MAPGWVNQGQATKFFEMKGKTGLLVGTFLLEGHGIALALRTFSPLSLAV